MKPVFPCPKYSELSAKSPALPSGNKIMAILRSVWVQDYIHFTSENPSLSPKAEIKSIDFIDGLSKEET